MSVRWREWAGIYGADIGGHECQIHAEGEGWRWMVVPWDDSIPEHQDYADDLGEAQRACEARALEVAEAEAMEAHREGLRPWPDDPDDDG